MSFVMDVVGDPPDLTGLRCEAFLCQGFQHSGALVETANVVYLRFGERWHKLVIDGGTVIWRCLHEAPVPWTVPAEGWEYPHTDVGRIAGVIGQYLEQYTTVSTTSGGRVSFRFEHGSTIEIHNEDDRSNYNIII